MTIFREKILRWFAEQEGPQAAPAGASIELPAPAAQLLASEEIDLDSPPELVPSRSDPRDGRHCPRCGSQLWRPFCSGVRCGQCGFQQNAAQAIGVSRRDYEAGLYAGKRTVMNSRAFLVARARLLGR